MEGLTRPLLEDMARSPPTHSEVGNGLPSEQAMSARASCILPTFPLHLARCCCRKLGNLPLVQSPIPPLVIGILGGGSRCAPPISGTLFVRVGGVLEIGGDSPGQGHEGRVQGYM